MREGRKAGNCGITFISALSLSLSSGSDPAAQESVKTRQAARTGYYCGLPSALLSLSPLLYLASTRLAAASEQRERIRAFRRRRRFFIARVDLYPLRTPARPAPSDSSSNFFIFASAEMGMGWDSGNSIGAGWVAITLKKCSRSALRSLSRTVVFDHGNGNVRSD